MNQFASSGKYEVMVEDRLSDGDVFARSLAEPEIFTIIFDRYHRLVYGYLSRRVGRVIADDLAAETFIRAFERRSSYDTRAERALPWILGIAVNQLGHHRRSEARTLRAIAAAAVEPKQGADSDSALITVGTTQRLVAALEQLDEYDREALLLFAWGELKYREIADVLGIPVGTVRSRLNRARRKLRHALESNYENVVPLPHTAAQDG